jgi:predicted nucleotidyltransferase
MRLTPRQIETIRGLVQATMGERSRIWLFGSRADDHRLGGDVDLYVEPERTPALWDEARCRGRLSDELDLGVDLVVARPGDSRPIERIARATGVLL